MNLSVAAHTVAAIVHPGKGIADAPLLAFIESLIDQGLTIRGLVAHRPESPARSPIRSVRDLETGTLYPITEDLGSASDACCLVPAALMDAGVVLRRAAQHPADLVVINRFGTLEAEGKGFNAEILNLITLAYPVLTVVSETYLPAWRAFTGGMAHELQPDLQALITWFGNIRQPGTQLS